MSDDGGERIRQTREREVRRLTENKTYRPLASPFEASVVGVSFAAYYPDNLHALSEHQLMAEAMGEPLTAVILHDGENEHDANAVAVHVPALGKLSMIGHLPRPIAARLAPELDTDVHWQGEVALVRINPEHEDRPGITIKLKRI